MRLLQTALTAAAMLCLVLVPATSFDALQTGCATGPAIPMNTTQSPRTVICSDPAFNYCCTSKWDLKCVERADGPANFCGRDLWTKLQIPNTQQFLPRDFNVVAIGTPGDI